jgi:ascorbate-specific PTS system EIIC-type component UlaA
MLKNMIFAVVGFALIVVGFYVVVPTWNLTGNAISGAANNVVTNPTLRGDVNFIGYTLTILVGYSFLAMGIGDVVYLLLYAWRRETIAGITEDDAF